MITSGDRDEAVRMLVTPMVREAISSATDDAVRGVLVKVEAELRAHLADKLRGVEVMVADNFGGIIIEVKLRG